MYIGDKQRNFLYLRKKKGVKIPRRVFLADFLLYNHKYFEKVERLRETFLVPSEKSKSPFRSLHTKHFHEKSQGEGFESISKTRMIKEYLGLFAES